MSRYILIGTPQNTSLTLVDLEEKTVQSIAPDSVDASIAKVRQAGATVFRGVDVAIAIDDRADAVGRYFFDGGAVR